MKEAKKQQANIFFGPVPSIEFAERLITDIVKALLVIAALKFILALVFSSEYLLNAVLISIAALWLEYTLSRASSIILLFFAGFASITVTVNLFAGSAQVANVAAAYLIVLIAIRATHATYALHEFKKEK